MKLLDVVVTKHAIPEKRIDVGEVGTIVEVLDDDTVLVEFSDMNGEAYAITQIPIALLALQKEVRM